MKNTCHVFLKEAANGLMDTETWALCIMKYKVRHGLSYWLLLLVVFYFLLVRGGHTEPGHAAPQANSAFCLHDNYQQIPKSKCQCSRVKWAPMHKWSVDEQVSPSLACEKGCCSGPGLASGHLPYHGLAGRTADGPEIKPPSRPAHLPAIVVNKSTNASFLRKV